MSPAAAGAGSGARERRGVPLPLQGLLPSTESMKGMVFLVAVTLCYATNAPAVLLGTAGGAASADPAAGDATKQMLFLATFGAAVWLRLAQGGVRSLLAVPVVFLPALAWFWLSILWAIDPSSSFRRITFTTVVILTMAYCVQGLSARRVVVLMSASFAAGVVLDWVAVALLPQAIHGSDEMDPSIIGSWRGIHGDKNGAGGFLAMALIVFLHEAIRLRSWISGGGLVLLTLAFFWMTQSKTALAFVALAIPLGVCIQLCHRHVVLRRLAFLVLAGLGLPAVIAGWDIIGQAAGDFLAAPDSLTGRVQIWPVLVDYAADHLLAGSGYGSFWGIGPASPLLEYRAGWLTRVYQAHNGYLDILVQTGVIGLVLVVVPLVLVPLHQLLFRPLGHGASRWMLASMLIFGWFRDLMETSLMDRATSIWPLMVIAYCLLAQQGKAASPTEGTPVAP